MIPGDKSYYPGTDVLINNFGIRDAALLRQAEYRLVHAREVQARMQPIEGKYDLAHLQKIHRHLFQDVYGWAGELRTVDFAKRDKTSGLVSQFTPSIVLDLKGDELAKYLADKNGLKGLSKPEFVNEITEVHTRLNAMHPFREGNGRAVRIYLVQLAREAGFEFDVSKVDKDRWNLASARAMPQIDNTNIDIPPTIGNQSEMRKVFDAAIRPTMAHVFLNDTREAAIKEYPVLEKAYARIEAITKAVSALPGRDVPQLVEAERTRIARKLDDGIIPPLNAYLQGRFAKPEVARELVQKLASRAEKIMPAARSLRM